MAARTLHHFLVHRQQSGKSVPRTLREVERMVAALVEFCLAVKSREPIVVSAVSGRASSDGASARCSLILGRPSEDFASHG